MFVTILSQGLKLPNELQTLQVGNKTSLLKQKADEGVCYYVLKKKRIMSDNPQKKSA